MVVTFDYIKGKRQGQIRCESDLLESIRNHFSVKNDAAAFIKDPNKKKFIASRKYAITPTGLFDFGLHDEIRKHINTLQITQIQYTPDFIDHKEIGFDQWEVKDYLKYDQRYYQKETVEQCLENGRGTCVLATSSGKCYGKGTEILMYDGSVEMVENLRVGDYLMGEDSTYREIGELVRGEEMMYKISPIANAEPFAVNGSHILVLKVTNMSADGKKRLSDWNGNKYLGGDVVYITVDDYLKCSKTFKHCTKLFQVGVDFQDRDDVLSIPPYLLGFWLGDGSKTNGQIYKHEKYYTELKKECDKVGYVINISPKSDNHVCFNISNGLLRDIRIENLYDNKHVPIKYLLSNRKNREDLLAGLLDSDGSADKSGIEFSNTNKDLIDAVVFLSRSLGYNCSTPKPRVTHSQNGGHCDSWRIFIRSNKGFPTRYKIPFDRTTKRDTTVTAFKVEPMGHGEYFGFNIIGDNKLHILGNFIVSHNSLIQASLIENFIKHWKGKRFQCLLIVPGLSLVSQLSQDFDDYGVSFTHSMWTGGNPLDRTTDVIICNIENVTSAFTDNPWIVDVDLLIQDECHRVNSNTTKKDPKSSSNHVQITKMISKIKTPHKFGFTGTLSDQIMDKWKTLGAFGPIIYEKKSKELRDENYITDVNVTVIRLDHKRPRKMTYLQELDFIYESPERNNIIRKLSGNLKGNTLVLVNHLKHGEALVEALSGIKKKVYFVKGEMKVSEREDIKKNMELEDHIVTIAMSSIFSTGINIKNIHNILFVAGGKSFIRTVQSIGRGLRLHDNKKVLTIIDVYDNLKYSERHVEERKKIYENEQIQWREKSIDLNE